MGNGSLGVERLLKKTKAVLGLKLPTLMFLDFGTVCLETVFRTSDTASVFFFLNCPVSILIPDLWFNLNWGEGTETSGRN